MLNTYFDNGATSFPKPRAVAEYMYRYLTEEGGTYGRSAYGRVLDASGAVETAREILAKKIGTSKPEHVVFTHNATSALNTIIFGLGLHDCHILLSPMEHNAVIRPIELLHTRYNVSYDILPHAPDGLVRIDQIRQAIRHNTRLVIVNHQSNVNGCIQPVKEIKGEIGNIPMLVDLAQSFGSQEVNVGNWGIEFAAFTGHKGLMGPTGTGGFFAAQPDLIKPLLYGGTGSRSESFSMPDLLPDKFEAGTPNVAGLIGLLGALENPVEPLHTTEHFNLLLKQIEAIPDLICLKANDSQVQGHLFSLLHKKCDCSSFANALYTQFGIETRSGLHCAPLAHQTLKTFPHGTVRIALSPFHSQEDLQYLLESLQKVIIK